MKRYKLKRDMPAFKAGTECYIEEAGNMVPCRGISYTIVHKDQLEKNPNILTDWFEEIEEPLIKDEKIRKAVRAWAEANGIGGCICKEEIHCITFETERGMFISFEDADPIPPEGNYTIEELCGEDEE